MKETLDLRGKSCKSSKLYQFLAASRYVRRWENHLRRKHGRDYGLMGMADAIRRLERKYGETE